MGTSSLGGGLGQVLRSPHVQIESNPVPVTPSTMVLLRIDASSKKQNKHNRRCHDEQMISDSNEDSNTHRPSTLPTVPWGALDVLGRSVWEKSHSKEDPTAIWDRTERHASWPGDFAVVLGGSPCCCCCCCRCNVVSLVIADSVLLIYSLLARNKNQRPFFSRAWMREDADAQQRPMRCFHVWVVATLPADAMG